MKLSKQQLKQIIKEELDAVMETYDDEKAMADKMLARMRSEPMDDMPMAGNNDASAGDSLYLDGGSPNLYGQEILGMAKDMDLAEFLETAEMIGTEFEGLSPEVAYEWARNHLGV